MQKLPSTVQLSLGCTGHVWLLVLGLVLAVMGLSVLFRPSHWDLDGDMHPCVTVVVFLAMAIAGVWLIVAQVESGMC
ncbi:hypothetical protein [Streptomyces sp. SAJ15]|uniref:hypothetical protein n=1 Tax=Streptomyces sp. SAJ15 TaxID=2011095 RepID=UPI001185E26A|nr:hypothetical protein [Streptomyces sp. SAJ15]TVL88497.1 hypothetical protein CD790_31155 [Streptomyces sp. SAJ15]